MVSVQRRNLAVQFLLMVVTIGFYGIYWYYVTLRELFALQKKEDNSVILTILLFIPLIQAYSWYKQGELFEAETGDVVNRWVLVLLWTFFPPAVWLLVQLHLNKVADRQQAQLAPV